MSPLACLTPIHWSYTTQYFKTHNIAQKLLYTQPLLKKFSTVTLYNKSKLITRAYLPQTSYSTKTSPKGSRKYTVAALISLVSATAIYYYYSKYFADSNAYKRNFATLHPFIFNKFQLVSRDNVTHDTILLRFEVLAFDKSQSETINKIIEAGIWTIDIKDHFMQTFRSYTPINYELSLTKNSNEKSKPQFFDIIVKRYPHGNVSKFIHEIPKGQTVEIRAPCVTFPYFLNKKTNIGMIAGGTGIAPMFQLANRILTSQTPENLQTCITIVYGSKTSKDVYLKKEIDSLVEKYPNRLKVLYLIENSATADNTNIKFSSVENFDLLNHKNDLLVGRPDLPLLKKIMPNPDSSSLVVVSGPDVMMSAISGEKTPDGRQGQISGILGELGYNNQNVFKL
ncbi:hypothetical protein BB561_005669 [Smittium simulii]|uniref:FAD-binding FR-type domain-containing protein n=1 Tax=Smittium simulii TaxID=133385 RepID=A0A2T9Y964_9FUNG|nr:hypothetical protein BB561_005669 [Smittium simulii]